ncbi:TetR/AcrR family transcriptional regulator [Amycolatopsis sp. NPDC058986]|uniref:TetR/AcrR family transcriptional regulator n=1 Tax=unclassified Amycolatopsis TaxID=2618356 RepID=UPI003673437E
MSTDQRPLRRDARRNREALVTAARETFGTKGLDAPLEEIARRAGVAIGTLYNRFPTRDALVEAAFLPTLRTSLTHTEEALAADDPWDGFVLFLERSIAMQVADRGFTEVCVRTFGTESELGATKLAIGERMGRIIARAQESGALRADFRLEDLGTVFAATTGSPRWRRSLGLLLDGFRAEAAHPLPED